MSSSATTLLAAVLWMQMDAGDSISCYTCSSRNGTDINCHDPFNPAMSTYTENCKVPKKGHIGQFPAHYCLKVIGKTVETGVELVIRACTLENMDNQCGVFKFEKDTFQGCILTCDFDGCNGQMQVQHSRYLLIAALAVVSLARATFHRISNSSG